MIFRIIYKILKRAKLFQNLVLIALVAVVVFKPIYVVCNDLLDEQIGIVSEDFGEEQEEYNLEEDELEELLALHTSNENLALFKIGNDEALRIPSYFILGIVELPPPEGFYS